MTRNLHGENSFNYYVFAICLSRNDQHNLDRYYAHKSFVFGMLALLYK